MSPGPIHVASDTKDGPQVDLTPDASTVGRRELRGAAVRGPAGMAVDLVPTKANLTGFIQAEMVVRSSVSAPSGLSGDRCRRR